MMEGSIVVGAAGGVAEENEGTKMEGDGTSIKIAFRLPAAKTGIITFALGVLSTFSNTPLIMIHVAMKEKEEENGMWLTAIHLFPPAFLRQNGWWEGGTATGRCPETRIDYASKVARGQEAQARVCIRAAMLHDLLRR